MKINHCYIYNSQKKQFSYLYLAKKDDFSELPEQLLSLLGKLTFTLAIDLNDVISGKKKLVQADVNKVIEDLNTKGYYLQHCDNVAIDKDITAKNSKLKLGH